MSRELNLAETKLNAPREEGRKQRSLAGGWGAEAPAYIRARGWESKGSFRSCTAPACRCQSMQQVGNMSHTNSSIPATLWCMAQKAAASKALAALGDYREKHLCTASTGGCFTELQWGQEEGGWA